MNKKLRKLGLISLTSMSAFGVLSLATISRVKASEPTSLTATNNASETIESRVSAPSMEYQSVFASIKTPGDSSTGGTFGCDNQHSIYLTTYNNLLAWKKDVTQHRAFLAAKQDTSNFTFDASKAAITSFKKVHKLWNGKKRDILYVSLSTFKNGSIPATKDIETAPIKETVILPYDAVTGEDLITVTEADDTIDWKKNLFIAKNDILVYNEYLDRFYLYRFGKINDLQTNKCESFVHFYGKGFQGVSVTQKDWNTKMLYQDGGSIADNSLYAIIPTDSKFNVLVYYDNTIGQGTVRDNDSSPPNDNAGRITAVVTDANLNVLKKVQQSNAALFPAAGVNCSTNERLDPSSEKPVPLMLEYGLKFSKTVGNFSYVGYLQSSTWNCLMIYKVDNTTGDISVANSWSLQENLRQENGNVGFDITYSCFDEVNKTIYFSNTWAIGSNSLGSYNGTAINSVKISDDFTKITMPIVTKTNEGKYEGTRNDLNYAVAPYYGKDGTVGVICSKSAATKNTSLAQTTNVSYTKEGNADYVKKDTTNRSYFVDFQERSDAIWNTADNKRWASSITQQEITAEPSSTPGSKNLIVVTPNMPNSTTFSVEELKPNDEKGTLTFNLVVTSDSIASAPATNSKIFVSLNKFREIGNAEFLQVAQQTNSTDEQINARRTTLEGLYNNVPSQITPEIILHGFKSGSKAAGSGVSPFWYSPNGSYYNDFYTKFTEEEQLTKLTIDSAEDKTGTLTFTIDFTGVTPDSILDQISGSSNPRENKKHFVFDKKFANTGDNFIKVSDSPISFSNTLYSQVTALDVVNNYIVPYNADNAPNTSAKASNTPSTSGKAIVTNNLGSSSKPEDKDTWLVDLAHDNTYKWKMVKQPVDGDKTQINSEHPLPAFDLYYQFGAEKQETPSKMVKILSFKDNRLKYNPDNLTNGPQEDATEVPDPDTSSWKTDITNKTTFETIYDEYFDTQPTSPMLHQPLSTETKKAAYELIGNVNNVSGFDNYSINEGVSPYKLWENIKGNVTKDGETINIKSLLEFDQLPFDPSTFEVAFMDKNGTEPTLTNGGIIVRCNNSDNLGGMIGDVIKPIPNKEGLNGEKLNGYYRNNKLVDSYLDLSFKIVDGTNTNIKNATLGITEQPDDFYKITDKFVNTKARSNIQWGWTNSNTTKIIQANIKNVNPYFNYSVEELSKTVSSEIINNVLTTTGSGTQEITVEDILNSSDKKVKEGLSLDKPLDELDPAILSDDYTVNPLIVSANLQTCIIEVIKDNANGVATLLISVPKTLSSSEDASVEITQTINITGFKKPTNWFLVAGIPAIIATITIATIVTIVIVKKVSKKNLKKFIDNQA